MENNSEPNTEARDFGASVKSSATTHNSQPGIYTQEITTMPSSIIGVPTSIPVFIGYTEQSQYQGTSLLNQAIKISSFKEFTTVFGKEPLVQYNLRRVALTTESAPTKTEESATPTTAEQNEEQQPQNNDTTPTPDFVADGYAYYLDDAGVHYRMYDGINWFYHNNGGDCYVLSIGTYDSTAQTLERQPFLDALKSIELLSEAALLVIPDAVQVVDTSANSDDVEARNAYCYALQSAMLQHCADMRNRFAILDIPEGYRQIPSGVNDSVDAFRKHITGTDTVLRYGAAYYPWLNTSLHEPSEAGYQNVNTPTSRAVIADMLQSEFRTEDGSLPPDIIPYINAFAPTPLPTSLPPVTLAQADEYLATTSVSYRLLLHAITTAMNLVPPSAAIAGIYAYNDVSNGVWNAPAGMDVAFATSPSISISDNTQENLNAPLDGKAICAIRSFPHRAACVWGARTLSGNSETWRYIQVSRTLIYIEQSIKTALNQFVFEPNTPMLWHNVTTAITSFLSSMWLQGGLVGSSSAQAFFVKADTSTMTEDDIQNGNLVVIVGVSLIFPAEFAVLSISQQVASQSA